MSITFSLKTHVTNGQGLVNNQNVWIQANHPRKRQANIHSAGIRFYRTIHKITNVGKSFYVINLAVYNLPGTSKDRSVKVDILTARKFRVKAGAKL